MKTLAPLTRLFTSVGRVLECCVDRQIGCSYRRCLARSMPKVFLRGQKWQVDFARIADGDCSGFSSMGHLLSLLARQASRPLRIDRKITNVRVCVHIFAYSSTLAGCTRVSKE